MEDESLKLTTPGIHLQSSTMPVATANDSLRLIVNSAGQGNSFDAVKFRASFQPIRGEAKAWLGAISPAVNRSMQVSRKSGFFAWLSSRHSVKFDNWGFLSFSREIVDMFLMTKATCAADVMQTRLTTVGPKTHFSDAVSLMLRRRVSGLPIVDAHGNYLGMFSEKCCLRILQDCPLLADSADHAPLIAREAMASKLLLLRCTDDVFDGIEQLLLNRVSGAPVIDEANQFVGTFSEKTSVSVLIRSVFDGLQSAEVGRFADRDASRIVDETTDLGEIVERFVHTEFRRLPVLKDGQVVGQVSRRDVINHPHIYRWICERSNSSVSNPKGDIDYNVLSLADTSANTIRPELDMLAILGMFLSTPYRRLPVLEQGRLVGQISRRDVLQKVLDETRQVAVGRHGSSLYLSALNDEAPKFA